MLVIQNRFADNKLPTRYAITLPYQAIWADPSPRLPTGDLPWNELLFADRHTLVPGVEPWFDIAGYTGLSIPSVSGDDDLLMERGIFQTGADAVSYKAPPRQFTIEFALPRGDIFSRSLLAAMFSPDFATAASPAEPTVVYGPLNPLRLVPIPGAYDLPNPWTFTAFKQDGSPYHIDFFPRQLGGEDREGDEDRIYVSLACTATDPRLYGDEITVPFSNKPLNQVSLGSQLNDDPVSTVLTHTYTGTARTGFVFEITEFTQPPGISAIGMKREPGKTAIGRFANANWPDTTAGWTLDINPGEWVRLDTEAETMTAYYSVPMLFYYVLVDVLGAAHYESDFSKMQLFPNYQHTFFVDVLGAPGGTVSGNLIYRPRYWGI